MRKLKVRCSQQTATNSLLFLNYPLLCYCFHHTLNMPPSIPQVANMWVMNSKGVSKRFGAIGVGFGGVGYIVLDSHTPPFCKYPSPSLIYTPEAKLSSLCRITGCPGPLIVCSPSPVVLLVWLWWLLGLGMEWDRGGEDLQARPAAVEIQRQGGSSRLEGEKWRRRRKKLLLPPDWSDFNLSSPQLCFPPPS